MGVLEDFDYSPLTDVKIIITDPVSLENVQLAAGKIHTYVFQMFNNPTDKFRITLGLDFEGQDNAVTTWFSKVPAGIPIEHAIPLSRRGPKNIQLTQSSTNIFLPCDQFGTLINLPSGTIFFNFRNRENRNTFYTMIIIISPCV